MQKLKKTIAIALTGFSAWWPSWPPPDCNLDGPIGSTIFCPFPPVQPPSPPSFPILPPGHACPLILKPVCGINGVTYENQCLAPVPTRPGPCSYPAPTPLPTPSPTFIPPTPPPLFRIFPNPPYIPPQPGFGTFCDPHTGVCIPISVAQ